MTSTRKSPRYTGPAASPYTWVVTQGANADGVQGNDPIYVPASATEISLTNAADFERLNIFLAGEECVFAQRGRMMERNSCRNPWTHFVDFRMAKRVNTFGSQAMEITADIFNLLNLINSDWGLNRQTSGFEEATGILNVAGWDAANNQPRYSVPSSLPSRVRVSVGSSRWRMQLGVRYTW